MTNTIASVGWRCAVCGYVHRGAEAPEFCPICGADRAEFEPRLEEKPAHVSAPPTAWRCLNCSYVHAGVQPPEECPVCAAPAQRFEPRTDTATAETATGGRGLRILIVGGGVAGVSAAESARQAAPEAEISIVSREAGLPYYRLNLTRFLAGELDGGALCIHPETWYAEQRLTLLGQAEVSRLLLDEHRVRLAGGDELPFDKLILAAGAHPFVPPVPGSELAGVTTLRSLADAHALVARVGSGRRCVCIGGGLLGLETAGALAQRGAAVTLLEGHDWLMPRQLNRRAGEILGHHVEALGITLRRAARTAELLGRGAEVRGVRLADETELPADLVVIATGVRPNSALARAARLEVDKGVVVDSHLRTSHPDVFAAGDVAEHNGMLYGAWSAAQFQGAIAGMNAAGLQREFGGLPRANALKVLGLDVLSIGEIEPRDGSFAVIEQEQGAAFTRFVVQDGVLVGAVFVGDATAGPAARRAIETRSDLGGLFMRGIATVPTVIDTLR